MMFFIVPYSYSDMLDFTIGQTPLVSRAEGATTMRRGQAGPPDS